MRVLIPLLGALALAALLVLWLRSGRERVTALPGREAEEVAISSPRTVAELGETPALTVEPAGAPEDFRREPVVAPGETVAGRVEVEGGIPPGDEPVVVAYAHLTGVPRLHSRRFEARVARDGSFAIEMPEETRSVGLELEALLLFLPGEVEVRPGTLDVVLRPKVFAAVRGRVHRPLGLAAAPDQAAPIHVSVGKSSIYVDPDGSFELVVEPSQPLELVAATAADEEGQRPMHMRTRLTLDALWPGEIRALDVFLEAWFSPRGVVVGQDGAPVEGAAVVAVGSPFRWEAYSPRPRTDASGRFELTPPLPAGEWELLARASGHFDTREAIVLPQDAHRDLRIVLGSPAVVRGRVLKPDGRPHAGARVAADERRAPDLFATERVEISIQREDDPGTDSEGRFTLELGWATSLFASAPGFAPSLAIEVEPGSGEELAELVLQLRPGCRLRGRVLDQGGKPVKVALSVQAAEGLLAVVMSDEQGEFDTDRLPPGSSQIAPLGRLYSGTLDVELDPSEDLVVELRLEEVRLEPAR